MDSRCDHVRRSAMFPCLTGGGVSFGGTVVNGFTSRARSNGCMRCRSSVYLCGSNGSMLISIGRTCSRPLSLEALMAMYCACTRGRRNDRGRLDGCSSCNLRFHFTLTGTGCLRNSHGASRRRFNHVLSSNCALGSRICSMRLKSGRCSGASVNHRPVVHTRL